MGTLAGILYPLLAAVLPVVRSMARHPGQWSWSEAALVNGVLLGGCAVIFGAIHLGSRGRSPRVAALALLLCVLWFYSPRALLRLEEALAFNTPVPLAVAGVLATLGLLAWLPKRPRALERSGTFLTLATGMLVTSFGCQIAVNQIRAYRAVERSPLRRELAMPLTSRKSVLPRMRPDIYLIVLDRYAHSSVLREYCGFDNLAFEDSLRTLGFSVPRGVWSNYSGTSFSLPSLLNFRLVTGLVTELGSESRDYTLPNRLVEYNRTAAFLQGQGYRFFFVPSQWWPATRSSRQADVEVQVWDKRSPARALSNSHLWRALEEMTALHLLRTSHRLDVEYVKRSFSRLKQLASASGPKFVFAHVISPHPPYVFTPTCEVYSRSSFEPFPLTTERYIEQVRCLNELVLDMVTGLLRDSPNPPVILLQGDHGTGEMDNSCEVEPRRSPAVRARMELAAFGAYHLPAGSEGVLPDSLTIVNLLSAVLSHYFQVNIPSEPGHAYVQGRGPFSLIPVDSSWLKP